MFLNLIIKKTEMKKIGLLTIAAFAMSALYSRQIPTCPSGCSASLTEVEFDDCNPETNGAQVAKVYLTNIGEPLIDWTDPLEWAARLDNSAPNADSIITLSIIGSKPIPTSNEKDISGGRKVTGQKTHILTIKIDETNITNHEFLRQNECGGNYLMWYETLDGKLYGGTEGIVGALLLDMNIAESSDELTIFEGKFEWKSKFTEERTDSPIA